MDAEASIMGGSGAHPGDVLPAIVPAFRREGRLVAVLTTAAPGDFTTFPAGSLDLRHDGIAGDRHFGFTRASGSREPWHPRGTEIRNRRQLSVLSVEELAEVAAALGIAAIEPAWIGGNLVIEGVPRLSFLPSGTRLHFPSGATVLVEHPNGPCQKAGRGIAAHHPGRPEIDLAFARLAKRRRGVVASVDRAGRVAAGDRIEVHVPEQWHYPTLP